MTEDRKLKDNYKEDFSLFWADQLAQKIIGRKKFRYSDKEIPEVKEFVVKTSASISGVLHIGRLSDTIRGASVLRALEDSGVRARLIWVAEDMDPLRKIPEGVPASYEKYVGVPVTDIPDPDGCHESYAEHHKEKYFEVLHEFVFVGMEKFSTRAEYRKGSFSPYIKRLLEKVEAVKKIQNRYRTNPLKRNWSPWTPICEKCGKIVTARVTKVEAGMVHYTCKDYIFESTTAKGCNYRGVDDPMKGNGKLLWKGEWAAEWAFWKVCCEGAGKEYIVPNSAFWVNAEIVEHVLDFPAPEPLFYEHLMIDGAKMSASLGNVVYPHDWLQVASPQLLAFFYNKRLMMTRSFSWRDLPQLYDEYDDAAEVYFGLKSTGNEKEDAHVKRLYGISGAKNSLEKPIFMGFSHAAMLSQIFSSEKDVFSSLMKTGQYQEGLEKEIIARIKMAGVWLSKYAPESERFVLQETVPEEIKASLSEKQKEALKLVVHALKKKEWQQKELFEEFYSICEKTGLDPREFFRAGYLVLLNKDKGPKLAPFILALGEKAFMLLDQV